MKETIIRSKRKTIRKDAVYCVSPIVYVPEGLTQQQQQEFVAHTFDYFKKSKPQNIEILKNYFNDKIEKIIQNLISKKIVWKDFFEDKMNAPMIPPTIGPKVGARFVTPTIVDMIAI